MKTKLSIYFLPVLLVAFLVYGYSTQDDPIKDIANITDATNTIEYYNSTRGNLPPEVNAAVLYSQAELVSNPGAGFGGADASAITSPGTLFGFGNQQTAFNRMADDFTIPAGGSWTIDSIIIFNYQTGSTTTSTITNVNLQVWNGATPGTGTVVAGDSTTNRLGASYFSNIYRVTATTLTDANRPIMRSKINMNGAVLGAGTYWIDYCVGGTLASGPWNPPRTIANQPATGNAYQRTGTTGLWAAAVDGANAQGAPFIIYGTSGGGTGGSVSVCRRNIHKSIPENGGNGNPGIDTIIISGVPAGQFINRMSVKIDTLIHSYIGDLRFWLTKVGSNRTDTLISRPLNGAGSNSCNDYIGTNLVDSATLLIQTISNTCVGGFAQATGNFKPKEPLGVFTNIDPNGTYILKVSDNANIDTGYIKAWCISIDYSPTIGISNNLSIPDEFKLAQNYPNPFNPSTTINYSLPKSGLVSIKVYDLLGKEVATLVNEAKNAGNHEVTFNASNFSSGVYFYRIESGAFVDTKKMFLLK